jgi:ABC-2 type transport system permease protein
MNSKRVQTIIKKEWAEVFKNRWVVFTIIFLPLVFTAIPLVILILTNQAGVGDLSTDMPEQFSQYCQSVLTSGECFQVYITSQFMSLFLMMPLIIPINIAAYSIVGEKSTHSLEPLLATPITTAELLSGKNLAAVIPAVLATWIGFGIYALGTYLIVGGGAVFSSIFSPVWLIAIGLVGPLMAVLAVNFSIMVSSRVNDPRAAEQLSTVVILPVLVLFLGQVTGFFFINARLILLLALGTLLLDWLMIYLAVQLFQRETILTRWK